MRIADDALRLRRLRRHRRSRLQLVQHLPRRKLSKAHAGQQLRLRPQPILAGDLVVVRLVELAQRQLVLARLAVQQLSADLDRALALMLIQPVLDLVARPRALRKAQPVAAGSVSGLRRDLDDVAVAQLASAAERCARSPSRRPSYCPPRYGSHRQNRPGLRPSAAPPPCPSGVKV